MVIKTNKGQEILIDDEDFPLVSSVAWRICKTSGYVVATATGKKTIRIHRLIMKPKPLNYIDHINHDKLDNRKVNLRECSPTLSACNRRAHRNNKSGYKGVFKQSGKNHAKQWRAKIKFNGTSFYLGDYFTPQGAAKAYNEAALKIHGEFANLNTI